MNVVNMPFSEPSRASEPKSVSSDREHLGSNATEERTKFGEMVETDSKQDKDGDKKAKTSGKLSEDEKQAQNQEIAGPSHKGSKRDQNQALEGTNYKTSKPEQKSKVEEFLYDYQKASAESSFSSPSYQVPRGFEDYAHPQLEGANPPNSLAPQNTLITQNFPLNNENDANKFLSSFAGNNLNSYTDMKALFSNLNQNLAELESRDSENTAEIAEKVVIPIPPILNFLNHDFAHIEAKEIPSIVTKSPFLNTVLNADSLENIMSQAVHTSSVLESLGFSNSEVEMLTKEVGEFASPNEILNQLGFDSQQIGAEISILKNNLQLEGLAPYMERAEELYNEITASKTPSLVIEPKNSKAAQFTNVSAGSETTKYTANPGDLNLVTDLNEMLAKEQIEQQVQIENEEIDLETIESNLEGTVSKLNKDTDSFESDKEILSSEDDVRPDMKLSLDQESDNNSMLESNQQTFEITEADSTAERVELVKNIIDRARMTVDGDMKTMQFNIKTENLGNINLAISSADNALQVSIKTDVEEARQTLANEMGNLQESLGNISNEIQSVEVNVEHDESWTQNQGNFFEKREKHEQQQSSRDGNTNEFMSETIETTEIVSNQARRKSTSESSTLEVRV